ncbi:hypothetical protein F5I97DRAFT_1853546 [Phlebopus sp. FC_14]|nr:hypothetical protein F5I97DRAFT_1853546 [Phlebopus sp. FC_14]
MKVCNRCGGHICGIGPQPTFKNSYILTRHLPAQLCRFVPMPTSESITPSSLDTSSSSSTPPPVSPTKARRRPVPLRLDSVGIDPSLLVGKVLTRISRSSNHPSMQLYFSDDTIYQILVDGYDPIHRGLPKQLEMDPDLGSLLDGVGGRVDVDLTIDDCALITLTDKAFESRLKEQRWDQNHIGVAFKFSEDRIWHCVWATLTDHENGICVFRSYDDVYVEQLQRSPRKRRPRAPSSTKPRREDV